MQTKMKLLLSAAGLSALVAVGFAGAGMAQGGKDGPGPQMAHAQMGGHGHHGGFGGHGKRGRFAMQMLERYDANGDGKLSQEEIDQGRADRLASFDSDKDGKLSLAEFEALWLDAMRERMVDRFQDFDDDGDGLVTGDEYGKRFKHFIERHDRNGDGLLGFDDRRSEGPGGPHHGGSGD